MIFTQFGVIPNSCQKWATHGLRYTDWNYLITLNNFRSFSDVWLSCFILTESCSFNEFRILSVYILRQFISKKTKKNQTKCHSPIDQTHWARRHQHLKSRLEETWRKKRLSVGQSFAVSPSFDFTNSFELASTSRQ